MAGEAASALGLSMVVLAEHPDDAACDVASEVVIGSLVEADLRALAARCEVMTFDHEQVDLSLLRTLVAEGVVVRPGVATLEVAVDKAHMRRILVAADIAVPAHIVVDLEESGPQNRAVEAIGAFAAEHGWPVVLKAGRGGYDGKGVWPVERVDAAARGLRSDQGSAGCPSSSRRRSPLRARAFRRIVRGPTTRRGPGGVAGGRTTQIDGVCRAGPRSRRPAELTGSRRSPRGSGSPGTSPRRSTDRACIAVEIFWPHRGRLLVNEIRGRPHKVVTGRSRAQSPRNSRTTLRAVLDLPLGRRGHETPRWRASTSFAARTAKTPRPAAPRGLGRSPAPTSTSTAKREARTETRTRDDLRR